MYCLSWNIVILCSEIENLNEKKRARISLTIYTHSPKIKLTWKNKQQINTKMNTFKNKFVLFNQTKYIKLYTCLQCS